MSEDKARNICQPCSIENCLNCENDSKVCEKCEEKYFLDQSTSSVAGTLIKNLNLSVRKNKI